MSEVTVEYGANEQSMPGLVGKTITVAIETARALWVLPEKLEVELNGDEWDDFDYVLEDGDELQLVKPSGDKGL